MIGLEDFMHRLPNDVGGQPSPAFARVEHPLAPWEKRCHALADVLDYHKLISTEEKRRGVAPRRRGAGGGGHRSAGLL